MSGGMQPRLADRALWKCKARRPDVTGQESIKTLTKSHCYCFNVATITCRDQYRVGPLFISKSFATRCIAVSFIDTSTTHPAPQSLGCSSTMEPLKFAPWTSDIDIAFYSALATLKLHHDKLDSSTRRVLGLYQIQTKDPPQRSARMQIHGAALTKDE